MCAERRQRGLTLIELIVFIVIVGAALAGVLSVLNLTTQHSADPMVRKQALSIAEAILEEALSQPFTWCDPDDAAAVAATQYADCTVGENNLAAEGGEARATATPFDNVNDYNGLATATNVAATGTAAPFNATVAVTQNSLNGVAADASLLVTVTVVAGPENIQLQGYRLRHSPTLLP
jgi:MSHA pilin protein MshD